MGISRRDIDLLIRLRREGHLPTQGAVVEIGAQQLADSFLVSKEQLSELGNLFGKTQDFPLSPTATQQRLAHGDLIHLEESAPIARPFWEWLGFRYASVDVEGNESIEIDLNFDECDLPYRGIFDLVTNYGTTEHVANQLNAFKVIHDLARVGGVMVHHVPLQGMIGHGLINYNPKFFWMLSRSNRYQWLYSNVLVATARCNLPQDLVQDVEKFELDIVERVRGYQTIDLMGLVAVKKVEDAPFVPPVDVPDWTRTDNKKLQERYPTVFRRISVGR